MNHLYQHGPLVIEAKPGWLDVTDDIEEENAPFSLAKNNGVGILQFSLASYKSGKTIKVTVDILKQLLYDFSLSRELGTGFDEDESHHTLLTCAKSYNLETSFIRAWYCSDGSENIVLVTYVCAIDENSKDAEIAECKSIIDSLTFKKNGSTAQA